MSDRPAHPYDPPPAGYVWVAVADAEWRVKGGRRCRLMQGRRGCGAPSVAEMNRARHRMPDNWWAYCPDHLFGRWVEDGVVLHWILGEVSDA